MPTPDFRSRQFLLNHIQHTMDFYYPRGIDTERGGFFHYLYDDGSIFDPNSRHLVNSCRYVYTYAMAAKKFQRQDYLAAARHGLKFLREQHREPNGGYAWVLDGQGVRDGTRFCYGHMFVLLAYATALKVGINEAKPWLDETWEVLEQYFWEAEHGLYLDERSANWQEINPYRGQNANMHGCEAMLAAFEATGEVRYLERAYQLADTFCNRLAEQSNGLIWEHYTQDWQIDWDYNRDKPDDRFKPWGFQTGHQTEWAKLLLILERYQAAGWQLERAEHLFKAGIKHGWDDEYGGFVYGFAPDGTWCNDDKYFWVPAETLAAAGLLASRTGKQEYWYWYERIWTYAWEYFVDHEYGAWYHYLNRQNQRYDNIKCPTGKTDYHTMGACHELLNVL